MKIKNSFVTNSSSTSYIVCWDKKITKKDLDHVKLYVYEEKAEIVFNDSLKYNKCFKLDTEKDLKRLEELFINSSGIMETFGEEYMEYKKKSKELDYLFENLPKTQDGQIKNDCDESKSVFEEISKLESMYENYEYKLLDAKYNLNNYNSYLMDRKIHRIKEAKKFFDENKGKYVYEYTYGNEDGYIVDMESYETFSKLSFVEFNNH